MQSNPALLCLVLITAVTTNVSVTKETANVSDTVIYDTAYYTTDWTN